MNRELIRISDLSDEDIIHIDAQSIIDHFIIIVTTIINLIEIFEKRSQRDNKKLFDLVLDDVKEHDNMYKNTSSYTRSNKAFITRGILYLVVLRCILYDIPIPIMSKEQFAKYKITNILNFGLFY